VRLVRLRALVPETLTTHKDMGFTHAAAPISPTHPSTPPIHTTHPRHPYPSTQPSTSLNVRSLLIALVSRLSLCLRPPRRLDLGILLPLKPPAAPPSPAPAPLQPPGPPQRGSSAAAAAAAAAEVDAAVGLGVRSDAALVLRRSEEDLLPVGGGAGGGWGDAVRSTAVVEGAGVGRRPPTHSHQDAHTLLRRHRFAAWPTAAGTASLAAAA